jgi:uncharacterized membrane protein
MVRVVRGGGQVLLDLLELAVDGGLALQMLTVQALDELMSWLLALEVRVVAVTQVELAVRRGMVADPPTARPSILVPRTAEGQSQISDQPSGLRRDGRI